MPGWRILLRTDVEGDTKMLHRHVLVGKLKGGDMGFYGFSKMSPWMRIVQASRFVRCPEPVCSILPPKRVPKTYIGSPILQPIFLRLLKDLPSSLYNNL